MCYMFFSPSIILRYCFKPVNIDIVVLSFQTLFCNIGILSIGRRRRSSSSTCRDSIRHLHRSPAHVDHADRLGVVPSQFTQQIIQCNLHLMEYMHVKVNGWYWVWMNFIMLLCVTASSSYPQVGSFLRSLKNIDPVGLVLEFALFVDKISDLY